MNEDDLLILHALGVTIRLTIVVMGLMLALRLLFWFGCQVFA